MCRSLNCTHTEDVCQLIAQGADDGGCEEEEEGEGRHGRPTQTQSNGKGAAASDVRTYSTHRVTWRGHFGQLHVDAGRQVAFAI